MLRGCCLITIDNGPAGNFPEDQAQSPDVSLLVRLKDVHTNSLIQNLRGHVALGPHAGVIAHIEVVMGLRVYDSQTWEESRHRSQMQPFNLQCITNFNMTCHNRKTIKISMKYLFCLNTLITNYQRLETDATRSLANQL